MKYSKAKFNWDRYKFYEHLQASEDLLQGGWILHLMAPSDVDRFDDYLRCQSVDTRYARIQELCHQWSPETEKAYQPKYQNWYHLKFPLLPHYNPIKDFGGAKPYNELPSYIRELCNIAEKHLLTDQIFEKFVYDKTRRFKDEWLTFTNFEKETLFVQFKDSKWTDEINLRQQQPQAEFDPYYKPKQ